MIYIVLKARYVTIGFERRDDNVEREETYQKCASCYLARSRSAQLAADCPASPQQQQNDRHDGHDAVESDRKRQPVFWKVWISFEQASKHKERVFFWNRETILTFQRRRERRTRGKSGRRRPGSRPLRCPGRRWRRSSRPRWKWKHPHGGPEPLTLY